MTSSPVSTSAVELGTLTRNQRFRIAGGGNRIGTLLRLADGFAIVVLDRRGTERREPIAVALTLKVVPL